MRYYEFCKVVSPDTKLDDAYRMMLGLVDADEIPKLLDDVDQLVKDVDPLYVTALARDMIFTRIDRRNREHASAGIEQPTFGEVQHLVRSNAELSAASRILYGIVTSPPVVEKDRSDLYALMYGKHDEEERDRLERELLASKGDLERSKAASERSDARSTELQRLLNLAGLSNQE